MRKMRNTEEWKALITEKDQAGKTVANFCKEKGIHPSQFYRKQRELTRPGRFVQIKGPLKSNIPINIRVKDIIIEAKYGCSQEHLVEVLRGVLEALDD